MRISVGDMIHTSTDSMLTDNMMVQYMVQDVAANCVVFCAECAARSCFALLRDGFVTL